MKRYGCLWGKFVTWDNLVLAATKAQRGKRRRTAVQAFNFAQEEQLLRLQRELSAGDYRPGGFRTHVITRPKARLISAAPYRDRVVHHAVMNVLEPVLDRHFHPDSYACRRGKGTHAAADRLQQLMNRNRFAMQCDIRKFFPSIDHQILKGVFRRLIKDKRLLGLMDLIVDSSNEQEATQDWFAGDDLLTPVERRRGLPIGNLTSQWFANWYLNDLDHFVTSELGIGDYVRYCDDFILLHNQREALGEALVRVREHLAGRRLRLHEERLFIRPVSRGLTFVGYRTWSTHRLLRKQGVRRFRRRVRWMRNAYADGRIDWEAIKLRLASWLGHALQANSRRLVRRLSREWCFSRGETKRGPCSSRRLVEQQREQPALCEPQQQQPEQSEQQHRLPIGPALFPGARRQTRIRAVYGSRERGLESPGIVPVLSGDYDLGSRIYEARPDGAGRPSVDGPFRPVLAIMVSEMAPWAPLRRSKRCIAG